MSEYWKSAPRHYCKYCQTYVRDTKTERAQHDATGRHQGAVQRFLRNLHRDNERGERDQQRAKDEVARLNGIVSGAGEGKAGVGSGGSSNAAQDRRQQHQQRQLAPSDVKSNLAQLASMGVAIPEEYRKNMALAGEWSTVAERPIRSDIVGIKKEDSGDVKYDVDSFSTGVRKRQRLNEDEEDEEEAANVGMAGDASGSVGRGAWGSKFKSYKAATKNKVDASDMDIAALMGNGVGGNTGDDAEPEVKTEDTGSPDIKKEEDGSVEPADASAPIEREGPTGSPPDMKPEVSQSNAELSVPKEEDGAEEAPTVFFKKKKKRIKPVE
ncbi:MAG: hypothetical protein M1831_003003 [Alyxoria varia]|nr:MAG: hypothetical protein M1831_003003 [Alyxoria varia]